MTRLVAMTALTNSPRHASMNCKKATDKDFVVKANAEHTHQSWARIRIGQTGSALKPILAGSGPDRTAIVLKIGGSRLDRTEKIFVVLM